MLRVENHSVSGSDVAVSIVAYRHSREEIAGLLHSLSRTQLSIQVTLVDNSETPDLRMIVEAAGARYLHVPETVGFGAGPNLAMRETLSRTKCQAVINPDLSFHSDVLQALYDFMELHHDVGQVMPFVYSADGIEQRLAKRLPTPFDLFLRRFFGVFGKKVFSRHWDRYETRDLDLSVAREIPCLSGCFMFLRSSVLQQVGLFDERFFLYMEDFDLCGRIGSASKQCSTRRSPLHTVTQKAPTKTSPLLLHLRPATLYFQNGGTSRTTPENSRIYTAVQSCDYDIDMRKIVYI
jgi:GT2 family glycosyltransferase